MEIVCLGSMTIFLIITMPLTDNRLTEFALCREMLEVPELIARFDFNVAAKEAKLVRQAGRLFLTGEGSSRIFPAKSFIDALRRSGSTVAVATEGSIQAMEYDLAPSVVFGASNSGQTKELVMLFTQLAEQGHPHRFAVTANAGTAIEKLATKTFVLGCGKEKAVAATKSVVEQALVYRSLLNGLGEGGFDYHGRREEAGRMARQVLEMTIESALIEKLAAAPMIYYAARNNGVAEELTLKTNEIMRRKSVFLEGTYLLHGVEEIMNPDEVVVLIDPFPSELAIIKKNLADTIGMTVIAIAREETPLPTIRIPSLGDYDTFLQLLAGWSLLAHTGVALGIDLDKPRRARKIGNVCEE